MSKIKKSIIFYLIYKEELMKKRTKIILTSTLTVTGLILAAGGYWAYKTFVPQETPIDKNATVRTNYYQAINKKWLEKAEIPSDQPSNGVFYELNEQVKAMGMSGISKSQAQCWCHVKAGIHTGHDGDLCFGLNRKTEVPMQRYISLVGC